MLQATAIPVLRSRWILVRQKHNAVLYLLSVRESRYIIINPMFAVVLSLLDGTSTVTELATKIAFLFNISHDTANRVLDAVVTSINKHGDIVMLSDSWRVSHVDDHSRDTYDPLVFYEQGAAPIQLEPRDRHLAAPISLLVFFSGVCQTNCIYCYSDLDHLHKMKHLPLDVWKRILDDASHLGIKNIQLSGGDPLGRKDSVQFICELIKRRFLFLLSTKCFVSHDDAWRMAEAGFNDPVNGVSRECQVSIDTGDAKVAAYMVGRKGFLPRAYMSVQNMVNAGIEVRIKSVVTAYNTDSCLSVVDAFGETGVRQFTFSIYSPSHYRHKDSLLVGEAERKQLAEKLRALSARRRDLLIEGDALEAYESTYSQLEQESLWQARPGCSAGRTNLGVAPNGWAIMCEQMPVEEAYVVGDLSRQTIMQVWNSPELMGFIYPERASFKGTACVSCADFEDCVYEKGYCFRDSLFHGDRLRCPPPTCPKAAST